MRVRMFSESVCVRSSQLTVLWTSAVVARLIKAIACCTVLFSGCKALCQHPSLSMHLAYRLVEAEPAGKMTRKAAAWWYLPHKSSRKLQTEAPQLTACSGADLQAAADVQAAADEIAPSRQDAVKRECSRG